MTYWVSVSGQLHLPYEDLEAAKRAAENFEKEGFSCEILSDVESDDK